MVDVTRNSSRPTLFVVFFAVLFSTALCHAPSVSHAKFYIHSVVNETVENYTSNVFTYKPLKYPNFTTIPLASISLPNVSNISNFIFKNDTIKFIYFLLFVTAAENW